MPRGMNPNSLKNLKPIKPGEVRNPHGRPRRQYTEGVEEMLDIVMPNNPQCQALRAKYNLGPKATYRQAANAGRLMRMLVQDAPYIDQRNAAEGQPTERVQVSGPDERPLEIIVRHEQKPYKE